MSKATAGLAALGITLSGAVALVAVALVVSRGSPGPGGATPGSVAATQGAPDAPRPLVPRRAGEDDLAYVLRHPWWAAPPAREQLDAAVALVVSSKRGDVVWFDDRCRTLRPDRPDWLGPEIGRRDDPMRRRPPGWPEKSFYVALDDPARPTHAEVLRRIAAALDVEDFGGRR